MASSPFGAYAGEEVDLAPVRPDSGPPSTFGENFYAGMVVQSVDNSNYQDILYDEAFKSTLEAVNAVRRQEGLPLFLPPSHGKISQNVDLQKAMPLNVYAASGMLTDGTREQVADALVADVQRIRKSRPDFLSDLPGTRDQILAPYIARAKVSRAKAQETLSRGEGIGATVASISGGVTMAMMDPWNIATMPIGGGGKTVLGIAAREALVGGLTELLQTPTTAANRKLLGEELTAGEAVQNIAYAAGGAGVLSGLIATAGKYGGRAFDALTPVEKKMAKALEAAQITSPTQLERQVVGQILGGLDDGELVSLSRQVGAGGDPNVAAATTAIGRQAEIDAGNPYIAGSGDTYADRLSLALESVLRSTEIPDYAAIAARAGGEPPLGGRASAAPRGLDGPGGPVNPDALKAAIRGPESGGDDGATNRMGSSASGRYQFTEGTFKGYYRKVYGGGAAAADAAWKNQRFDVGVQERLMDALIADNAATLRRAGIDTTTGNMYVMHVLGSGDGPRLLQAAPDTPVARILSAEVIRGNPTYFGGGKSASEAIAAMHRVVGHRAASVPAGRGGMGADADGIGDAALLRDEALMLRQEAAAMKIAGMDMSTITSRSFDPNEIGVDAELMQFKGGGDEYGVTERLQGVTQWNPVLAGRAIVWEAVDGRRLIADGHQRLGLAKRIRAQDPAQSVALDALVLREADGWDAESVRVWAALKNVAEGSGTMVDAAKVMRSIGPDQAMLFLPPRSPLVRDAGGLSRLGDDAFGMVVNELVDPGHAAIVGRLLSDPGEQKALTDLLVKLQPATMSQADSIVRQGIAAGFTREQQFDMFGALDRTASLFVDRARVLERGIGELKKLKQVHSVAARNADALEAAGSKIDRAASAQETIDNATAIDLVQRLAFSAGPVKDILDAGARELADGGKVADVVRRFVRDVRKIDFVALARSGGDAVDGGVPDGAGRAGDLGEADGGILPSAGYSREPDGLDGGWPRRDEIDTDIERGFDPFDPDQGKLFDAPDSPGTKLQVESLEHDVTVAAALDLGEAADPAIAARRRQEIELRAGSPMRSTAEQDGTMGLSMFDRVDQGELSLRAAADEAGQPRFLVDLGDGAPVERTIGDLLDEFDADDAAIEKARKCL
ncbi:hypothetical protein [Sphingopyxis granuli]|uniref:hypothetical protein n=1 Tax=Sphingopyxis granuli TaxID=267128 RepID=UPI001BB0A4F5|nr:hypothetical protein [Sphingopyxis granuli]QUM73348.1 hypothetical protein ICN83_05530 [Sphingopyxis granuli]